MSVRICETVETLDKRLGEAEQLLEEFDRTPATANLDLITQVVNELDVMLEYFRREETLARIRWFQSRLLNMVSYQLKLALRVNQPTSVFEVPELHDVETRDYMCDSCKKSGVIVRILNIRRTIRAPYKCLTCGFVGTAKLLPAEADSILRRGKMVDTDHMVINKAKKRKFDSAASGEIVP